MISRRQATIELIFAAATWGFGFIAIRWTLTDLGPLWLNWLRFLLAASICLPAVLWIPRYREALDREHLRVASLPGLLLGAMIVLQTYGLQHTSVTRSGFITVLYIVFVPPLERILIGTRIPMLHAAWIAVALVGAALICQLEGGAWNLGDTFTLACAFCGGLQIVQLEKVAKRIRSPFVFNFYQCLWAAVPPLLLSPVVEKAPSWPLSPIALTGLLVLTLGPTLIGFLIQIRGQRVLIPSVVSMLFLLESPFAAAFAYLLLDERLIVSQWVGAALILVAAAGTLRTTTPPPAV